MPEIFFELTSTSFGHLTLGFKPNLVNVSTTAFDDKSGTRVGGSFGDSGYFTIPDNAILFPSKECQDLLFLPFPLVCDLEIINNLNPQLNSFITVDSKGALEQAKNLDKSRNNGDKLGPLSGAILGVKDSIPTKDITTTNNSNQNCTISDKQ